MDWYFGALLFSNILSLIGALLLKHTSQHQHDLISVPIFIAISLYGSSFIVYFFALKKIPLSFAQPFSTAFILSGITFVSWFWLGEKITQTGLAGLFLILVGVILLNF